MRVVAVAVALLASAVSAAGGRTGAAGPVAFLRGGNLVVVDLSTGRQTVALRNAGTGPVGWSGDGKLVSSGGRIAGGPALPAGVWSAPGLAWAPTGEIAAYVTRQGGVVTWSPERGSRTIVPDGWGATALAWSRDGRLAIGRSVCRRPCGAATRRGLWVWAQGRAPRRVLELTRLGGEPMPVLWDARGRVIWWLWPGSSSIAADGVAVYAGARRIGTALMYRDYVVTCGKGLALAAGVDRNSMHGKSIEVDGRDVSRDSSRSWVSPSCSGDGSVVVASAAPDRNEGPWGREHRAVWQLLPTRRQLTRPPAGWTDENPHVLADGSILFVRTRQTTRRVNGQLYETDRGLLELLGSGPVRTVASLTFTANELTGASLQYYGHYDWPSLLAPAP